MSAKEMFEKELDMELVERPRGLEYHWRNDIDYPYGYYGYVFFDLISKQVQSNIKNIANNIKYQKAINKQVEELGWDDK